MKTLLLIIASLAAVACSSNPDPQGRPEPVSGAAGAGTDPPSLAAGTAGAAGLGSTAGADAVAGAGMEQTVPECPWSGTEPEGAPHVYLELPGDIGTYAEPSPPLAIDGYVLVERVSPRELYLIGAEGRRFLLVAARRDLELDALVPGSRLWLSARSAVFWSSSWADRRESSFALRTDPAGPTLLAASLGDSPENAEDVFGVAIATELSCRREETSGISELTGETCQATREQFEVGLFFESSLRLAAGDTGEAFVGGHTYDVWMHYAEEMTYEAACGYTYVPGLQLGLEAAARDRATLVVDLPASASELPTCVLGSDQPPFVLDDEGLTLEMVTGSAEVALSPLPSSSDTLAFAAGALGTISLRHLSAEAHAVLERARWFSLLDAYAYVIRDGEGGDVLAADLVTTEDRLHDLTSRPEVLGLPVALEPACEWMSAACRDGLRLEPIHAVDAVFGDAGQRVRSHTLATVAAGARPVRAWLAVTPSCALAPLVHASFLATE